MATYFEPDMALRSWMDHFLDEGPRYFPDESPSLRSSRCGGGTTWALSAEVVQGGLMKPATAGGGQVGCGAVGGRG